MSRREPHTVPRGLLRFYILRLLTEKPMKGYEVITEVEDRTDGFWKPGPGSIYPMLESLKTERLIRSAANPKRETSHRRGVILQITEKGREELNRFRDRLKQKMPARARSLYVLFSEIAYPGMEFDEITLAERKRDIQRLDSVFSEKYWTTISAEKKREFVEKYSKIVKEELELIRSKLGSVPNEEKNA
jgi:DNA-binding PadR family transcriptional regulator